MRGGPGIYGRIMLLHLLVTFNKLKWRLVCSLDATSISYRQSDTEYVTDVHSWYFKYDETATATSSPPREGTNALGREAPTSSPPMTNELTIDQPPPYTSCIGPVSPPPTYEEIFYEP